MGQLRVTVGDLHFSGRWVAEAPRTVEAIRALLPLRRELIHCRWSGEGCWIPFGEDFLDLGPENATSHPAPGELIVYPGGIVRVRDPARLRQRRLLEQGRPAVGQPLRDADEGLEQLPEIGRRVPVARAPSRSRSRGRLTIEGSSSADVPDVARP